MKGQPRDMSNGLIFRNLDWLSLTKDEERPGGPITGGRAGGGEREGGGGPKTQEGFGRKG